MLKRELQEKADELGVDYNTGNTKAELKDKIKEKEDELKGKVEEDLKEMKDEKEVTNKKVNLKALRNTFLPDGKFIKKGQVITVSKAYSESIKQENNPAFKIIKK